VEEQISLQVTGQIRCIRRCAPEQQPGPNLNPPICLREPRSDGSKSGARYRQIRFFSNAFSFLLPRLSRGAQWDFIHGRDSIFAQMRDKRAHTLRRRTHVIHKFHPLFSMPSILGYFADLVFFAKTTAGWFGDLFTRFRRPLFSSLLFIKIMKLVAPRRPAPPVLRRLLESRQRKLL
jgi:hypothetical protein